MAIAVVDYVLTRLKQQGVTHLFGVPALYCAALFDAAPAHGITPVVTASDLEAGYAADGYARTKGLAAVSVANGVGTLSLINAIAGAYVERSPIVVINGGPTADISPISRNATWCTRIRRGAPTPNSTRSLSSPLNRCAPQPRTPCLPLSTVRSLRP